MTTAAEIREKTIDRRLADGELLIADGAMGTELYARGVAFSRCFEEVNLSEPTLVQQIHRDYLGAGAEVLETNTFGANRYVLSKFGLEDKVAAINIAGVEISRKAAGSKASPTSLLSDRRW